MHKFAILAILALLSTGAFFASGVTASAQEVASVAPGNASQPVTAANMPLYLDEGLATKHADFEKFAKTRAQALNRNHRLSRQRMLITKQPDGSYLARYHAIDIDSISTKVSRSKSKTIPFVGVMRFQEMIMEAVGNSPELCRTAHFKPVSAIPNRQIFSYKKGTWQ
ncbi:hypothetical protein [Pseudodesulfovibrio indicus]|uniref:hypothetical protein n=1 Tax=Pseudodesulfovibrio indicus TaxID=1716143 RepID=UPI002930556B|nr:hypothetical protein [Pseudodesulfovibrio indicus]